MSLIFYQFQNNQYPYSQNYTDTNGKREYQIIYPGKTKEDFSVDIDENKLIIRAGDYKTNYILPENCDKKNISAEYIAGILKITLPRKPTKKPRKIEVN